METKMLKTVWSIIWRSFTIILLVALLAVVATGVSPVYDFAEPSPFSGRDIFNPYRNLDTAMCWKRANFHTHTKVDGIFNECHHTPQEVYDSLARFGYDIVTFSNHNELTVHPFDTALQVDLYEHGYNLFKYHKLVFGCSKVNRFDNLVPLFTFQKQFQLDLLGKDSDFIQMNHPFRTNGTNRDEFEKLTGYRIMELDSGKTTEQEYWDWALSAGHYSFALANDDLHYPDRTRCIAVRCNFLCTPSGRYEDLKTTLLDGCYYSMRVPDYGNGDWKVKHEKNATLPYVEDIGLKDSTIYISLSAMADSIKVTGQNHSTLCISRDTDRLEYSFAPEDTYARFTAYFPDGACIYSNPFARYDASESDSPYVLAGHDVNIFLSMLYNLALLLACSLIVFLILKVSGCKNKKNK